MTCALTLVAQARAEQLRDGGRAGRVSAFLACHTAKVQRADVRINPFDPAAEATLWEAWDWYAHSVLNVPRLPAGEPCSPAYAELYGGGA